MDIAAVMDEIGNKLKRIPELNVYPWNADSVTTPAVVVAIPDEFDFTGTYGRGMDSGQISLFVVVGRLDAQSSRDNLAQYLRGSGNYSIVQFVDAGPHNTYQSCSDVTVARAKMIDLNIAGIDYLAAAFTLEFAGPGA